ncbi:MAG TPA: hypothetical protein EYP30_02205 [Archaeoglobaceae archaeon]|nr:hypothetical protein [Archaeoglobaceae archaeon]
MAKKMETKSARLLALILALIMIGSVFAMLPRGEKAVFQREIKYEFEGFDEWLKCLQPSPDQIIYVNAKTDDEELKDYIDSIIVKNWNRYIFANLRLDSPIQNMLVASYRDGLIYMIDVNKTRIFYAGQKEDYKGLNVKYSNGVMLVSEISPFIIGTAPRVASAVDSILSGHNTLDLVSNYTSRIPNNFNIIFMFYGEYANMLISGGNFSDYIDFYLEGIKVNESKYEKIVAIHFKSTGGFANYSVNDTEVTEYYNFTNYDDGFSIAVMQDGNFTKLLNAQPRLQPVIFIEPAE